MKKLSILFICLLCSVGLYAQNVDFNLDSIVGVISAIENRTDVNYEFINYDVDNNLIYFTYTWTQETKVLLTKTYTQYKCLLNASCVEENGKQKIVIKNDNRIFYRMVNADGSEIQGTPKISGVTYTWAENKTILNKKEVFTSVVKNVETHLSEELNKNEEQLTITMIKFFSNDVNLICFDINTLEELATKYSGLCSVPSLVWKLKAEKTELWFENYYEKVKNADFSGDLKISSVKKSDIEGYKYLVESNVMFSYFSKDNFEKLMKSFSSIYTEDIGLIELRKKTYNTYKDSYYHIVTIKYYSNDDKFADMNKDTIFNANGTLQSINTPGIMKQITSFTVYEK